MSSLAFAVKGMGRLYIESSIGFLDVTHHIFKPERIMQISFKMVVGLLEGDSLQVVGQKRRLL
jgi:hypothetical protein